MTEKEKAEFAALKATVKTLIAWMVQSANSPINRKEAEVLFNMIESKLE
jgi:hypothetical protein